MWRGLRLIGLFYVSVGTNLCKYWFRAELHNSLKRIKGTQTQLSLLSSLSATLKQALHADLKLVPRAKTSWASDILRAFEGLRGCDTYKLSCRGSSFVTADLMLKQCGGTLLTWTLWKATTNWWLIIIGLPATVSPHSLWRSEIFKLMKAESQMRVCGMGVPP